MHFEYDPEKSLKNLEKHEVDFEEAQKIWEGSHVIIPAKNIFGEDRFAILGRIRERVYIAIYTEREGKTRIISCHRADQKLEKVYYDYLKKGNT